MLPSFQLNIQEIGFMGPRMPNMLVISIEPSTFRDNYSKRDNPSSSTNTLYSVTQRVPPVASNFCQEPMKNYAPIQWESDNTLTVDVKKECSYEDNQIPDRSSTGPSKTVTANNTRGSHSSKSSIDFQQSSKFPVAVYLHNKIALILEIDDPPAATCDIISQAIISCEELGLNKGLATQVFSLWMVSPLLELQLKPNSKPFEVRQNWHSLVERYCYVSEDKKNDDEPKLMFQRNVFYSKSLEEKIKDQKILELLYEEAKYNILNGRYPCEIPHYVMLGGIQAREELGPYNPQVHSTHYFREEQVRFLPAHVRKSSTWAWLPISSKNSAEVRLLEQFKRIPSTATNRKLIKKYLEFCWSLPFYGAAFFVGQIEEPVTGLASFLIHQDIPVLIVVNSRGIYIIDDLECEILLGLRYEEFSWEYARPTREDNPDCLPCLFIQFLVSENGTRVSKILQVFSKQASLIDTLIGAFVSQINRNTSRSNDDIDKTLDNLGVNENDSSAVGSNNCPMEYTVMCNKLGKLSLATFDEDGHCIGQMGSWSFS
ncbi:putative FERM domain-containing protein FRMD8P1 isoform X2 [Cylas formicarius]|uniref:putative FERM domain-containing protein FRMD8P1 isoform X2 n=1 Tax=Cylas formicarius TaxID=197179 RepID=UPI0029585A6D|nr:putative FERM domain-containing protein FRMD8P1 isoform X2 [Cylas formicarius]